MSPRLVLGQLRAHAGRYLGTILAIAVAVAFVLASVGVLRTMAASADATFGMRYSDTAVLVQNLGDRTSASSEAAREEVAEAQRELVRIGIERPKASATGSPESWTDDELGSFERATFADLAQVRYHRDVVVLDVRRESEYDAGHIDHAVNVPLHEIVERVGDVPAGEVWVHCAGGYRASVAASVLDAAGRHVVAIDDSFGNAREAALAIVDGTEN